MARVLVGSALIVLAIAVWRADWLDLVIGLVALPAVATLLITAVIRPVPRQRVLEVLGHIRRELRRNDLRCEEAPA